ncbi:MAG: hypothetical protein DA329_09590 [Candidatus Nitrosocosmicus sp.]|nr:hypothetical protein [Candidatus Nitrosocosmicus sp.]
MIPYEKNELVLLNQSLVAYDMEKLHYIIQINRLRSADNENIDKITLDRKSCKYRGKTATHGPDGEIYFS